MNTLLRPFIRLMNRAKYAQKFLLITSLFCIPILIMLHQLIQAHRDDIHQLSLELEGVSYIASLEPIILEMQKHRGLANGWLNGDSSSEVAILESQEAIEQYLLSSDSLLKQADPAFALEEEWEAIRIAWLDLKEAYARLAPEESFQAHTALIGDIQGLITTIADQSQLTLDARLDTFYLATLSTNHLPALIETVGQARGSGNGILAASRISEEQTLSFMLATENMDRAAAAMTKVQELVLSYNPSLREELEKLSAASIEAAEDYSRIIAEQFIERSLTMEPSDYFARGTQTIDEASLFFDAVIASLDRLLLERLEQAKFNRNLVFASLLLSFSLATLLFLSFYWSVKRSVAALNESSHQLATGNLKARIVVESRDELGDVGHSFNAMAESIGNLIRLNQTMMEQIAAASGHLRDMSQQTVSATEEIAESTQLVAAGADRQLEATDETSRAMSEMAAGVQHIAEATSSISELAEDAANQAKSGNDTLVSTAARMQQIHQTVHRSVETMQVLGQRSRKIGDIVSDIANITAQTHILSLNAAIEAARAGEAGKGFSVVADEIRALAGQCKQAAESIAQIVLEIAASVEQADGAILEGQQAAALGLKSMDEMSAIFHSILDSVQQVAEQIRDTSAISEQMSAGTEEIAASVTELTAIAQQALDKTQVTSASSQELLSSMEEVQAVIDTLNESADQLAGEMKKFQA
ncbi:HAMP domain-containing protein [Xylanibacillus composti]|uniref:Methyl-accepting chemotaxis protein n=1 Tax=Xylanibacillus composti TaxID=1572762 RepID=A0A8J4M3S3_9BACL|nr:HAMP domain-containing methyl-accepting chemotaxis protein [Xylanibacillus composti]MDT9725726.1 HAMP domain-containing protein [Xylanibacillus composti]GIQ71134.1 methyl-accepting chemotaxis protein [Xylanibacillus composti]